MSVNIGIPGMEKYFPGLREGTINLIVGAPGVGKTILGIQYLIDGAEKNEDVLFISLNESAYDIKRDFEDFTWNLNILNVIDATPTSKKREIRPYREVTQVADVIKMKDVKDKYQSREIDVFNLKSTLKVILEKRKFSRVLLDSITSLKYFYTLDVDPEEATMSFLDFFRLLENTTSLIIAEYFEDIENIMRMMDSVIYLRREGTEIILEILKTSTFYSRSVVPLTLTKNGFVINEKKGR
ncbi:MAG: ATPase domain-containing protein [Thermoplasmata archaeon]|jgi:circadian clock protein KaiC|nr:recombinase RecA [Euryarchaeota archaeon]MVT14957.1 recombinase RecA [Euryarchaeota archaeon]